MLHSCAEALFAKSIEAVIANDQTGRVLYANPAACGLLGYSHSELMLLRSDDVVAGDSVKSTNGRTGDRAGRCWQGLIDLHHKDGTVIPFEASSVVISDHEGPLSVTFLHGIAEQYRSEEALRQSEERFRTVFEYAPIGMDLIDLDGHIFQANAAFCTLTGYAEEELLARTLQDITHPDDIAADLHQIQQLLNGEIRSYQIEKRYIRRDGEVVWVRFAASLVRDARGAPLHLIGQIEDITGRKRAEQELRASEERYRSLVNHLPAAVYVMAADENESLVYISPYIETLTGETPAEAQSLQEHWSVLVHPDDREGVRAEELRSEASGDIFCADYRHRTKDGDYVWVRDECVPLVDASGQLLGWQGFMIDISDRVRLEALEIESRTRAEQRDQLQVILDHLPVGILILREPDGQVEQANATAIQLIFAAGTIPSTLPIYRRDFRLVWSDLTPRMHHERLGVRALHGEVIRNEQLLLETADGRSTPVLAHAAPLPATAEGVTRSVLVLQDVTRLREAEQLKDDFLALVSHEFRTPITAIHGGAHLLHTQSAALDEATRGELLADIAIESDRLERRLQNILNLTAVMAGQLAVQTEPVMLSALVQEVATEMALQLPQQTLHLEVPVQLPPAEADPALLAQVLANLYENAAKYSHEGTVITTIGFTTAESVVLEVSDTGIGLSPEQVERVFERFHRAGADPTVRGMGLGLYLSRYLIEAQRGTLTARSPGLGQGATFIVTLPIAREWAAAAGHDTLVDETEAIPWSVST